MRYDFSGSIKGFVRELDNDKAYENKPFAFISYSHATEDVEKIYSFLKKLFEAGYLLVLDTEYAEMNDSWVNGMTKRVYNKNCKLMLTFTSKSYMYSRPSLIEHYCRYSEQCRKSHGGEVVPYMLVDTTNDTEQAYRSMPDESMISRTQAKNTKERYTLRENSESAECLRKGLQGFYSLESDTMMSQRIINREYEALQKYENVDEIRRQMRFVLQVEDTENYSCSIDDDAEIEKVMDKLASYGIEADEAVKEKAEKHFKEWGVEIYQYKDDATKRIQYNPEDRMFRIIKADGKTNITGKKDIMKITKDVLGKDIENPEEHWKCVADGSSFQSKHGYFTDYELTDEQGHIHKKVLQKISKYMNSDYSNVEHQDKEGMGYLIMIQGEAGTGKTVLAQKIFIDIINENPEGKYYFVVNHDELVSQYQEELKAVNSKNVMVEKPIKILNSIEADRNKDENDKADIIFVDEAHLMYTQKSQAYTDQKDKNKREYITADNMVADMRRNAKIVVLMFDKNQILQARQCWRENELDKLVAETIENGDFALLKRQMRITGSQDVMKWIAAFVGEGHELLPIPEEDAYDLKVFSSVREMHELIKVHASEEENKDSRVVATFDWDYAQAHGVGGKSTTKKTEESTDDEVTSEEAKKLMKKGKPWMVRVEEEEWELPWNDEHAARTEFYENELGTKFIKEKGLPWIKQSYAIDEVGSTFSVQGFDMPYVGVILGPSISYDKEKHCVYVKKENCRDSKATNTRTFEIEGGKNVSESFAETLIWNAVNILLTRGRKGLFIYAVDKDLREALILADSKSKNQK